MARDLGLAADPGNREALRTELRRELASLHPDRNGGSLLTLRLKLATSASAMRLPTSTLSRRSPSCRYTTSLAWWRQYAKYSSQPLQQRTPAQARAEFRETARIQVRDWIRPPRIGSGSFAAACAFLLTVGGKLGNDPVLGDWVTSAIGSPSW